MLTLNRCVPRYWTNKDLEKLREAKKVELNDWNKEVLAKITEGMADVFSKGRTQDGLTCIIIDKVTTIIIEFYEPINHCQHNHVNALIFKDAIQR